MQIPKKIIFDFVGIEKNIQQSFFSEIKNRLNVNTSIVEEVADILNLSTDSTYRRLRNKTQLTFEEVAKLAGHFNISLDKYVRSSEKMASFSYRSISETNYDFIEYLKSILSDLKTIKNSINPNIIYFAEDIPLPQLLFVPEVAAFKLFFWEKTILNFQRLSKSKFDFSKGHLEVNNISREIRDIYISIPSTEIYSPDTIGTTLKQIRYYHYAGFFASKEVALHLCDKLCELVEGIRDQASEGYKFHKKNPKQTGDYKLYFNEVIYSDTSILAESDLLKFSYLSNNGLRRILTHNEAFYDESEASVKRLLKKATLLSGSSEKERNIVFEKYLSSIQTLKMEI
ncbi:MAG: hypothetical protein JXQ87_13240 [Bacteroidia bacterium]